MKHRIFSIIQIGRHGDIPSIAFDYLLTLNIALNILVLGTIDDLRRSYGMTVYLVVRGDLSVLPESTLTVTPGDILILKSEKLAKPT